jgi:DHA1 family multidrug resistance protein-like MFS transporter
LPPSPALSDAERRRGLAVLMVTTFFAWGGFFLVVPLIAVHYVDGLGWAAATIGVALAIRQFLQQGLTTLSGALADKVGAKGLIGAGMLVRAVGFAALAWADTYPLLLAAVVLAAVGGALFDAPKSAAIAALTTEAERPRYFAVSGVVIGLGIALGTQAGALLLRVDFDLVALVSGACYLIIFATVALFLPPVAVSHGEGGFWRGFGLALGDRRFVTFVSLMAGHWFMSTQFFLTLPLATVAVAGSVEAVAWVTAINSAVTVLLGYPLPPPGRAEAGRDRVARPGGGGDGARPPRDRLRPGRTGAAGGRRPLLAGDDAGPADEQTVAASLADRRALGSYFGVAALSIAIGGGLGNVAGGYLYDLGQGAGWPALPWVVCALVGFASAAGLHISMGRTEPPRGTGGCVALSGDPGRAEHADPTGSGRPPPRARRTPAGGRTVGRRSGAARATS